MPTQNTCSGFVRGVVGCKGAFVALIPNSQILSNNCNIYAVARYLCICLYIIIVLRCYNAVVVAIKIRWPFAPLTAFGLLYITCGGVNLMCLV